MHYLHMAIVNGWSDLCGRFTETLRNTTFERADTTMILMLLRIVQVNYYEWLKQSEGKKPFKQVACRLLLAVGMEYSSRVNDMWNSNIDFCSCSRNFRKITQKNMAKNQTFLNYYNYIISNFILGMCTYNTSKGLDIHDYVGVIMCENEEILHEI